MSENEAMFPNLLFSAQQCREMSSVRFDKDPQLYRILEGISSYTFNNCCNFIKYCKELAEQLGVCGWVKNSKRGTIVGRIQGTKPELDHMIEWLSSVGSPGCKIEKCDLTNWEYLAKRAYTDFTIRF